MEEFRSLCLHLQCRGRIFILCSFRVHYFPTAAGIHVHVDGVPTKTEGRGRGRGRRRGRPPGSGGGLGRGARKQREDKIIMEPQQGATGGHSLEDQGTALLEDHVYSRVC